MILGYSPVFQALLGTLLTWGLTAAGSALVFIFSSGQRRILDGSLGFAAGKVAKGEHMTQRYCSRHKYESVAKHLNFDHMTKGMLYDSVIIIEAMVVPLLRNHENN